MDGMEREVEMISILGFRLTDYEGSLFIRECFVSLIGQLVKGGAMMRMPSTRTARSNYIFLQKKLTAAGSANIM